jgi:Rho-binding antiterminator
MPYRPINCAFYDELEARATLRQPCNIYFMTEVGAPTTHHGIIADLFIRDQVEYLRCHDGFEVRLDWLTAVDDREVGAYC